MWSNRRISLDIAPLANWKSFSSGEKTVVVLVGLPARGKSYISTKLSRYLNWVGINTRVFNVGAYRRLQMKDYNDHSYFSNENNEAVALRQKIASEALDDLISWLTSEVGEIAVFDATNTTRERRLWIMERCKAHNLQVIFVESICKDKKLIQENVLEVKVNSPDYKSMDKEEALKDFLKRIEHYERRYESIDDDLDKDWSYIKIFDQGKRYLANRIEGNINSRIVYYLMNIRVNKRTIYLTRHGETVLNVQGRIGGDGNLSERGELFAKKLAAFMEQEKLENLKVWTSHFKRTIQTAENIRCSKVCCWKALDELDAGVCDGMTYEEINEKYPYDFARRDANKYYYRYPMGEVSCDYVS
ncbi:6-phosphofructo-2-kinase/fructose-2,6-bisphosphatase [Schistosoma japonicum]|nr:6-phosphofructo-2-kinase/fructose-2,6-bisphosphatase [Schistosoma japonicum]